MTDMPNDAQAGAGGAAAAGGEAAPAGGAAEPQFSEEQLRAYEAELNRITSAEMILQSAVSLLNIGGRRLGLGAPDPAAAAAERDLEQVRDAIDAVSALLPVLERRMGAAELAPMRDAISQLQMFYAREMSAAGGPAPAAGSAPGAGSMPGGGEVPGADSAPGGSSTPGASPTPGAGESGGSPDTPGPAQSSGRLWVPGR